MGALLRNFDRFSFWLGFLAAALLIWLIRRLKPVLSQAWNRLLELSKASRIERSQGDEIRIGNDVLRKAQSWHLASMLFSLDEILIPPRLLAPSPPPFAYEPPPSEDITDWAIPYTPDQPEFASYYNAPTLDVLEALQGGANLALIGKPGCGKSVALACLACLLIRKAQGSQALNHSVPLLLHVGELDLPLREGRSAIEVLSDAVAVMVPSIPSGRLPNILHRLHRQRRLLLILDGLDELAPAHLDQACQFLEQLLREQRELQVIVAAHPTNLGSLPKLGFQVLAVAGWNKVQRAELISRWSVLWPKYIAAARDKAAGADSMLLTGWLLNSSMQMSPLELTLKTWATFCGDSIGPGSSASIEAYLRRMTAAQPSRNRMGLEQLAAQMVLAMDPLTDRVNAEHWLGGSMMFDLENIPSDLAGMEASDEPAPLQSVRARGALPDLMESGLVLARAGDRISLIHPYLTAYLASHRLLAQRAVEQLAAQPEWSVRSASLQFISSIDGKATWLDKLIKPEHEDILQVGLLQAGSCLQAASEGLPWVSDMMRRLALVILNEHLPAGLRARAFYAMTLSNNSGMPLLLRQLLENQQPIVRQLAALGSGYLRDKKSVEKLITLIHDQSPGVSSAALLGLVAIGEKNGLEAVASTLVHGEEHLRRAAAEALANDTEEGHPTLQEASALDDPGVRRAVVFGLGRLKLPWVNAILERMVKQDTKWIVQDAASQVLSLIQNPNPRIPQPLPPLPQTAWLIAFASESGMGVAPGKSAFALLHRALQEGNEDQRLAALHYLALTGNASAVLPIYQIYFSTQGEIHEAAFNALWNLAACGTNLPHPAQYGLS